jgi:hypothetical protein
VAVITATHHQPMATPHATLAGFDDLRPLVGEDGLRLIDRAER